MSSNSTLDEVLRLLQQSAKEKAEKVQKAAAEDAQRKHVNKIAIYTRECPG